MSSENRSNTNLVLLIIATVVGGLIACFVLTIAVFGYLEVRDINRLGSEGVITLGRVTDSRLQPRDCYEVQYEFIADDQTYSSERWSDCLSTLQRVQAEQFRSLEVVYLPDDPSFHRPSGVAFDDLGVGRFMTGCFSVIGLMILMGLVLGWVRWNRSRDEADQKGDLTDKHNDVADVPIEHLPPVYPIFTLYHSLSKKIGLVDTNGLEGDKLRDRLELLQRRHAEVDEWVFVDHFGRTPLGEQKVSVRFYDGFNFVKPMLASLGVLVWEIASRPDYVSETLLVQNGPLSFAVQPDLKLPLRPILSKQLRGAPDTVLSKRTDEIADYQVHSFMFSDKLNQKVGVIHHPRYPTSGRYPSEKVLDLIQAELDTQMELQLVVPRKVGRGQQFEVRGSYRTVPISDLTAESALCIAKAIHKTGLASETIYLSDFESDPTLFVDEQENVFITLAPTPRWTRVEFRDQE